MNRRDARSLISQSIDHSERDGNRQPREHAVPCGKCGKLTLNISAICGGH